MDMPIPSPSGLQLKQRSPSIEKKEFVIPKKNQLQNGAPQHTQNQHLSSLGVPSLQTVKKSPARPKPTEDDIFASMGLAAQPKFQHAKPVRSPPPSGGAVSSSGSSWGALSAGPVAPRSAPAPVVNSFDADAWDDADLDDLLDDK